jgi:hypothetical protein
MGTGCIELIPPSGWIKDDVGAGEEKGRMHSAMRKSSYRAHTVRRRLCNLGSVRPSRLSQHVRS